MNFPLPIALIARIRSNALRALALISVLFATLTLAACGDKSPAFQNLDITGNSRFARDFSLPDSGGTIRSLADYKGKVVVMTFGYTRCPDVCPTTLAELSQALESLEPDAARRVQVLFVTVDPQRDTGNVLAQYVAAFNASFRALRPANNSQLEQSTRSFQVAYEKVPCTTANNYTMNHTAACLVFDPNGKLRLYVRDGQGVSPWLHDLKILLNEKS
jgi:protein SCO1/2